MAQGSAHQLSPIAAYVAERTGSSLSVQQLARLQTVLDARMEPRSEDEYLAYLRTQEGEGDLAELMSAIAVHKTDLFRDEVQLRAFDRSVLRPLASAAGRPLHVWSAGCATGEEVATLLIMLAEAGAHPHSTVLGTDISEPALRQARELAFHPSAFKRVPDALRQRYFVQRGNQAQLVPDLRARASFARHNLMDLPYPTPPAGQGFDLVFCRNVLIYFTAAASALTVDGLAGRLNPGGTLILSAAEPLLRPKGLLSLFKCEDAFFYVRRQEALAGPLPSLTSRPSAAPQTPRVPLTARTPRAPLRAVQTPAVPLPAAVTPPPASDAEEQARQIFELVQEGAAAGDAEAQTEQGLRRCIFLDPHFAQARYFLGILLEQRGERALAATEYRRALSALREGRSRQAPFFLNDQRLQTACNTALRRLGFQPAS